MGTHNISGKSVIVDDQDDHIISASPRAWFISGSRIGYVVRYGNLTRKKEILHRILLNAAPKTIVDHINGDSLDNRRANLRICTHAENLRNRKKHRNSTSRFKGVTRHRNKWQACISFNKRLFYLGLFESEREAAAIYDAYARKLHGEFARLNFP